jgi:allophanate hydrolase subunit 2
MGANNVVILLGEPIYNEDYAQKTGEAIVPGMLVEFNSSGTVQKHATAGGDCSPDFAMERDEMGNDIDDAYADGDTVKVGSCHSGMRVHALIASGQNIAKADYLESAGNGTLRVLASGTRLARALEAVNNSAGPGTARIRVVIVK